MLLNIFAIDDDEVASELMLHLFLMAYGCFLFTVTLRFSNRDSCGVLMQINTAGKKLFNAVSG